MALEEPTLLFLRHRPEGWASNEYVASSLQSLESSFLLIALGRFSHALVSCASAIENVLLANARKAKSNTLKELIERAIHESAVLQAETDRQRLDDFQDHRNKIVHRGFSPTDDSDAAELYVALSLPFLSPCYQEHYSFNSPNGLLVELSKQLRFAQRDRQFAKSIANLDISNCLHSFAHLIRWKLKQTFSADWEFDVLVYAYISGFKWDTIQQDKKNLERLFPVCWTSDCPVCEHSDSTIAEISETEIVDRREVIPCRMACVECNFVA